MSLSVKSNQFNELENAVMELIRNENGELGEAIYQQFTISGVLSREYTGAGFFLNFKIDEKATSAIRRGRLVISGPEAEIEGLEYGAGFTLFVSDGFITTLEGFSYGEPWPQDITKFVVRPFKQSKEK